jgi:hypothetical protein
LPTYATLSRQRLLPGAPTTKTQPKPATGGATQRKSAKPATASGALPRTQTRASMKFPCTTRPSPIAEKGPIAKAAEKVRAKRGWCPRGWCLCRSVTPVDRRRRNQHLRPPVHNQRLRRPHVRRGRTFCTLRNGREDAERGRLVWGRGDHTVSSGHMHTPHRCRKRFGKGEHQSDNEGGACAYSTGCLMCAR